MTAREVELLSEEGAKELLVLILTRLEELDDEDYFGTEGWQRFFEIED